MRDTAYILCANAMENPNYSSWLPHLAMRFEVEEYLSIDWPIPPDAAILITHMQYRHLEVSVLRRAMEQQIPVLILADGILEYRNSWLNPTIAQGAVFNPVVGHALACIGESQKRWVESWGGTASCHVVGIPRLDEFLPAPKRQGMLAGESEVETATKSIQPGSEPDSNVLPHRPFRVLVSTARQPGFDETQLSQTRQVLSDIAAWNRDSLWAQERQIEIHWRISGNLATELNLKNADESLNQKPLIEILPDFDALLTTPSTTMLEGMLCDIPTVLLDYYLCPQYVPAAWQITHRDAIEPVIREVLAPSLPKMEFQRQTLHDSLACCSPATPRLLALIESLVNSSPDGSDSPTLNSLEKPAPSNTPPNPPPESQPTAKGQTQTDIPEPIYFVELDHARRQIRADAEQITQLSSTAKSETKRANQFSKRFRVTQERLREQSKTYKKMARREQHILSTLKKRTVHANQVVIQNRKLKRLAQQRKKLDKQRELKRAKLLRIIEHKQRRLQAVSDHRKSLVERVQKTQATNKLMQAKIEHLDLELSLIKSNWAVGPLVKLLQRIGSRSSPDSTTSKSD